MSDNVLMIPINKQKKIFQHYLIWVTITLALLNWVLDLIKLYNLKATFCKFANVIRLLSSIQSVYDSAPLGCFFTNNLIS